MQFPLVLGVSARHAHLCREHMDILFGAGSELHVKKKTGQPGQYRAEFPVDLPHPRSEPVRRLLHDARRRHGRDRRSARQRDRLRRGRHRHDARHLQTPRPLSARPEAAA